MCCFLCAVRGIIPVCVWRLLFVRLFLGIALFYLCEERAYDLRSAKGKYVEKNICVSF